MEPGRSTFVATVNDDVAAFCCFGPSRDEDASESVGEIYCMYVHPAAWRQGIGRQLCEAALEDARERGFLEISLWVLDSNANARRFYESQGFQQDGATRSDDRLCDATLPEVRYRARANR